MDITCYISPFGKCFFFFLFLNCATSLYRKYLWRILKDLKTITRPDHNNGSYVPFSLREVSGFFNIPFLNQYWEDQETGRVVHRPYPRRLEQLTVYRCHSKGNTFSSVVLRPSVCVPLTLEASDSHTTARTQPPMVTRRRWPAWKGFRELNTLEYNTLINVSSPYNLLSIFFILVLVCEFYLSESISSSSYLSCKIS